MCGRMGARTRITLDTEEGMMSGACTSDPALPMTSAANCSGHCLVRKQRDTQSARDSPTEKNKIPAEDAIQALWAWSLGAPVGRGP